MKRDPKTGRPRNRQNVARDIATDASAPCLTRFNAILAFEHQGGAKQEVVSLLWRVLEDAVTGTVKSSILEKLQALEASEPTEAPKAEASSEELFAMAEELKRKAKAAYWREFHTKFDEDLLGGIDDAAAVPSPIREPVPVDPVLEPPPVEAQSPQVEQDPEPEPSPVPAPAVKQAYPASISPARLLDATSLAVHQQLIQMRQQAIESYPVPETTVGGYSINWGVPFSPAQSPDPPKPAGADPWQALKLLGAKD